MFYLNYLLTFISMLDITLLNNLRESAIEYYRGRAIYVPDINGEVEEVLFNELNSKHIEIGLGNYILDRRNETI